MSHLHPRYGQYIQMIQILLKMIDDVDVAGLERPERLGSVIPFYIRVFHLKISRPPKLRSPIGLKINIDFF